MPDRHYAVPIAHCRMLSSLSPYEPRLRYRIQPCDQEILALARKAGHRVGPKKALHGLLGKKKHTVRCLNRQGSVEQKPHFPNTSREQTFARNIQQKILSPILVRSQTSACGFFCVGSCRSASVGKCDSAGSVWRSVEDGSSSLQGHGDNATFTTAPQPFPPFHHVST
jgi:hypothetical protein